MNMPSHLKRVVRVEVSKVEAWQIELPILQNTKYKIQMELPTLQITKYKIQMQLPILQN